MSVSFFGLHMLKVTAIILILLLSRKISEHHLGNKANNTQIAIVFPIS
ncbi:hypothetical protein [Peribacillus simplex]